MNLTRRDWLKSLAVAPIVGVAAAAPIPLAEKLANARRWSWAQSSAIASKSPLILLTGGRGSGKSWVIQRIIEGEIPKRKSVGLIVGGGSSLIYRNCYQREMKIDHKRLHTLTPGALDYWRGCATEVLIVENAEMLNDTEFADLMRVASGVRHILSFQPERIIVSSMWSERNAKMLRSFERHHLGSTFDNPYLCA